MRRDWSAALPVLEHSTNLYTVGRGHGFGIAQEMALKIKETCGFHAEAFSAAEVRHGRVAADAGDIDPEMVGRRHGRPWRHGEYSNRQLRPIVQPEDLRCRETLE